MALRLGDILVEKGILTPQQLEEAAFIQQESKELLGEVLLRLGFVTENQVAEALAQQQGLTFLSLSQTRIDQEVIRKVPAKIVWHYRFMPVKLKENILTIAVSDPFDMLMVDDLETHLGVRVEKVLATVRDISDSIQKYYGVGADTIEQLSFSSRPQEIESLQETVQDLEKKTQAASVIRLVNQIFQQAIVKRATDIHFERFRKDLSLRYRIDGILYDMSVSENIKYFYSAIISRIKVMSGLDIVERRLPQDGRTKVKIQDNEYDLRVSVVPTLYGENIVVRILPLKMLYSIKDLGLLEKDFILLENLLKKPYGIIFVTGPTGSGKSTTLYSCLQKLNTRERKIITIEDPVEYELEGVSQIQVNPKIELSFAKALRSVLRHDPDILMVGEIRDKETADISIQAALTGHLVFSTLHTNDSASASTRLIDIGVEPYLITSSVNAFIAQRLVRVICKNCKEAYSLSDAEYVYFSDLDKQKKNKNINIYRGKGCPLCNGTGYFGRIGIYEILIVSNQIRELIVEKASADKIRKKAIEEGLLSLRADGWKKILEGITTPEEVIRVIQEG